MSNTYNVSSIMLLGYNFIFHIFALLRGRKMIIFFNIIHLTGKSGDVLHPLRACRRWC